MKTTGRMERRASPARMDIDVHDTVSPDDDSCCSVVPAWIATNDGGATPARENAANKACVNVTNGTI